MDDFSVLTRLLGYLDSTQEVELKSLDAQTWILSILNFVIWGKTPHSKSVGLKKTLRMEEFQKYVF